MLTREDGRCGNKYPLPDGTPAGCDPDGDTPCCSDYNYGRCYSHGESNCFCRECVDYRIVSKIRRSKENCTIVRWYYETSIYCDGSDCGGFLKYVCFNETTAEQYFKCAYSDVYYRKWDPSWLLAGVSEVCENDPHSYQVCGLRLSKYGEPKKLNSNIDTGVLCGAYVCGRKEKPKTEWGEVMKSGGKERHHLVKCTYDCKAEKRSCNISQHNAICDDHCDTEYCEDESDCNSFKYGVNCIWNPFGLTDIENKTYLPPNKMCQDRSYGCLDGRYTLSSSYCVTDNSTVHTCSFYSFSQKKDVTIPIYNYTRCSLVNDDGHGPYCPRDYLDQTNCSDIERVGGYCWVNGYWSSVSKYMVCYDKGICDDKIENKCIKSKYETLSCEKHRHRMCDGSKDCLDGRDEFDDACKGMSDVVDFNCTRRFNWRHGNKTIPVSWILDNVTDCMDGEDENKTMWLDHFKCQRGKFIVHGEDCQDVFKCPRSERTYVLDKTAPIKTVPLENFCDGVESCDQKELYEKKICRVSRDLPPDIINDNQKKAPYNGTIRDVCSNTSVRTCEVREFRGPWNHVFGVMKTELLVPTEKVKCKQSFGEHYMFLSCMNLCLEPDVTCPLEGTNMKFLSDSCPGMFLDRAYSIFNNSHLTFVRETVGGNFHQEYFQCRNGKCVEYKQVCDIVDDCGDMSDEINCANHMICDDTKNLSRRQLVSLDQTCDGIYDCLDLSDECNDRCRKEILGNYVLKITCWSMGILAILFNTYIMARGSASLPKCKSKQMMTSKVLMTMIGLGDFLVGLYLVILSIYDTIIFGHEFCIKQAEWLTGTPCLALGVVSTLGSQISLFTMTVLSVIRMHGVVGNEMRIPEPPTTKSILGLIFLGTATVAAAMAIAVTPLMPSLEDYFVQGMHYSSPYNKLFSGFPNKDKHIKTYATYSDSHYTSFRPAKEYFSPNETTWSWRNILESLSSMFSQDYGSLQESARPVHFYGNDGVCLFKYFVRTNDGRRSRQYLYSESEVLDDKTGDLAVWTMLGTNLLCFVVITICYAAIVWKTKKSSQRSGQQDNPERMKEERAIQRKIMMIIATDFLCWVPFIIISALHNLKHIDASSWYTPFAMTVLPLNSVINPLIYEKALGELIGDTCGKMKSSVQFSASFLWARLGHHPRRPTT